MNGRMLPEIKSKLAIFLPTYTLFLLHSKREFRMNLNFKHQETCCTVQNLPIQKARMIETERTYPVFKLIEMALELAAFFTEHVQLHW